MQRVPSIFAAFFALVLAVNFGASVASSIPELSSLGAASLAAVADSSVAPAAFCHTFKKDLSVGMTGAEVGFLQAALEKNHLVVTGHERDSKPSFGQATEAAVMRFQEKNGLPQTGYVGPMTRKLLNGLYGCIIPKPVVIPDRLYELLPPPSHQFAQGKTSLYREKVSAGNGLTNLGIQTFSIDAHNVSFSKFQIFIYYSKDFKGSAQFFAASSTSATSVSFDLRQIALYPGYPKYLEVIANATIADASSGYATFAGQGLGPVSLFAAPNVESLWGIGSLGLPSPVYANADFTVLAPIRNNIGAALQEKFDAKLDIADSSGKTVYSYDQILSGRATVPGGGEDDLYFGTVAGGASPQAMNFPPGKYKATVTLQEAGNPNNVLATHSEDFAVTVSTPKDAGVKVTSDALDTDTATGFLTDFQTNATQYFSDNGDYGPAVSTCSAGIFAEDSVTDIMNGLLSASGSRVVCRSQRESYAISVQTSSDVPPLCADSMNYVGPGKVDLNSQGIAYCLRGNGSPSSWQ